MRTALRVAGTARRSAQLEEAATAPARAGRAQAGGADASVAAAWRVLDAVSSWITFADAKAGAALAVAGVLGGVLINMQRGHMSMLGRGIVLLSAVLVVCSVACAGVALRPRRHTGAAVSLIFFGHIADGEESSQDAYLKEFSELVQDPARLVEQIGNQVWASSRIAKVKYDWVDRALVLLFCALFLLGVSAVAIATGH